MTAKRYEPAEGNGWEQGESVFPDMHRWRVRLDGDLYLTVTVTDAGMFVISRVRGGAYACPSLGDVGRIEREFGVAGWSIETVFGGALIVQAVEP